MSCFSHIFCQKDGNQTNSWANHKNKSFLIMPKVLKSKVNTKYLKGNLPISVPLFD